MRQGLVGQAVEACCSSRITLYLSFGRGRVCVCVCVCTHVFICLPLTPALETLCQAPMREGCNKIVRVTRFLNSWQPTFNSTSNTYWNLGVYYRLGSEHVSGIFCMVHTVMPYKANALNTTWNTTAQIWDYSMLWPPVLVLSIQSSLLL